ncbi:MAG: energy transducer TonB, partial [Myxococcota bacterium]
LVPVPGQARPHKVRLIRLASNAKTAKHLKRPKTELEKEKAKKKEKEEPDWKDDPGQIVDIPPSPDSTAPEDARFRSEYNTRVERETVSRHRQKDYPNAMNERTVARKTELALSAPQRDAQALEIGPEQKKRDSDEEGTGNQSAFEIPDLRRRDRLSLELGSDLGMLKNQRETETLKGNSKRLKLALGTDAHALAQPGRAPKQAPTIADLVPSVGVLARLTGAPANDAIEEIDEGEGTFLNSREFKFATYFNRMKRGVSQQWHPMVEYTRRDPTGRIYGYRSRMTVLNVTLDATGGLERVEVHRSSGLEFLDREALSAFRRAQPFPNPPKGLVGQSTNFTFPFGFHVDFTRRGGLRLPF